MKRVKFYNPLNATEDKNEQSTFILGTTGKCKPYYNRAAFYKALNHINKDLISIDPRGNWVQQLGNHMKKNGYDIKVLNIDVMRKNIIFNPDFQTYKSDDVFRDAHSYNDLVLHPAARKCYSFPINQLLVARNYDDEGLYRTKLIELIIQHHRVRGINIGIIIQGIDGDNHYEEFANKLNVPIQFEENESDNLIIITLYEIKLITENSEYRMRLMKHMGLKIYMNMCIRRHIKYE